MTPVGILINTIMRFNYYYTFDNKSHLVAPAVPVTCPKTIIYLNARTKLNNFVRNKNVFDLKNNHEIFDEYHL